MFETEGGTDEMQECLQPDMFFYPFIPLSVATGS